MKRLLIIAAALTVSARAAAQAEPTYAHRSFLLPTGGFQISGDPARNELVRVNASEGDTFGKPVGIAPHFYWGVSREVTLGITHEWGICLGCERIYNDTGFALLWGLLSSPQFELDLHMRAVASSIDPFRMAIGGGVIGRYDFSPSVSLVFDPSLMIGVTHKGATLSLPGWFFFQPSPAVSPFVGTGLYGDVEGFFGHFAIPVEGGVMFTVSAQVDLGAILRVYNLLGHGGSFDGRELGMLARFRF
ncbi:MAG TPA: hypothetical protein VK550_33415 [Polyangiaceae bacterium]|nr:hypothetical protein [Polyangiaceae bacterium]